MTVAKDTINTVQDSLKALTKEINNHLALSSDKMTISQNSTDLDPQQLQATMQVLQDAYKMWYTLEAFKRVV